jgi:hypothetical protein
MTSAENPKLIQPIVRTTPLDNDLGERMLCDLGIGRDYVVEDASGAVVVIEQFRPRGVSEAHTTIEIVRVKHVNWAKNNNKNINISGNPIWAFSASNST